MTTDLEATLSSLTLEVGPDMEEAVTIEPSALVLEATVLGRGAWGVVRSGTLYGHPVAVKLLPDATPEEEATALAREIRLLALATARCSGVCRLLGTCEAAVNGMRRTMIVMRRYERSLHEYLAAEKRALPMARVLSLGAQLARAVAELHEIPIVIGDLKPSNLLLDAWDQLVVADFGISVALEGALTRVMPSSIKGTINYMAPEALDPESFGGMGTASDVWGIGCVLVEMLSGEAPWHGLKFIQARARQSPPMADARLESAHCICVAPFRTSQRPISILHPCAPASRRAVRLCGGAFATGDA